MSQLQKMLPKLKTLRLSGILDTVDIRLKQALEEKLSHVEFLALLLQDEYDRRENKKLDQRLKKANFAPGRSLDDFKFDAPGLKINSAQIFDLATCRFIEDRVNVLAVGPTGVGKSHIAQALNRLCRARWRDAENLHSLGGLHAPPGLRTQSHLVVLSQPRSKLRHQPGILTRPQRRQTAPSAMDPQDRRRSDQPENANPPGRARPAHSPGAFIRWLHTLLLQ